MPAAALRRLPGRRLLAPPAGGWLQAARLPETASSRLGQALYAEITPKRKIGNLSRFIVNDSAYLCGHEGSPVSSIHVRLIGGNVFFPFLSTRVHEEPQGQRREEMKRFASIVAVLCVCALASMASAEQVLNFNGGHDQSEGTPLTKGAFNSYVGDSGADAVYYDGASGPLTWWVEPGHSGMRIQSDSAATVGIYWDAGGSYTFDGMDSTDVLFEFNEDPAYGEVAIYDNLSALVVNDGTVYTKLIDADPGIFDAYVATKADLAGTWTEYDMATGAAGTATIDLNDLDDITAFGGAFTPSSGNIFIASVEAYAVPEPATMSLLAIGGGLALIRRRRNA
jgi:hypothetical protein